MRNPSHLHLLLSLSAAFFSGTASAAKVGVIDSGVDTEHTELLERIWINPEDTDVDGIDQDNNGYIDDINGWNFAESNHFLIDRKFSNLFNDDIEHFFEIQSTSLLGTASESDLTWMKEKSKDSKFLTRIFTYGNYAHGTHVSGIISHQSEKSEIVGIKLIPTKNPLFPIEKSVEQDIQEGKDLNWILKQTIKGGIILFAKLQAQAFKPIARYVHQHQIDIVNGSFGIGPMQAKMLLTPVLKLALRGKDPSAKLVEEMSRFFLNQIAHEQQIMMREAPDTLFVFAAGNDGTSNDELPTAPASIQHPHVISVAATFSDGQLAPFSNFGNLVDLAAPGVAIESQVPDNMKLKLSGTSQAAPKVAGTAAAIKEINPALKSSDIKTLILETVDILPALKNKVKTSGMLNHTRAITAARLSLDIPITQAIKRAKEEVETEIERNLLSQERSAKSAQYLNVMPALLGH